MKSVAIAGADIATGFRFDVAALINFAVATAVVLAFAPACFGRSRAGWIAASVLFTVSVSLGCAAGLIEFVALWQMQWFVTWSLGLFFADDEVRAWLGRLVISGWLIDAFLIGGTLAGSAGAVDVNSIAFGAILAWGSALSLAHRIAALPIGANGLWSEHPRRQAMAWILISSLPSATVLGLRMLELLSSVPSARLGIGQFFVAVALSAGLASLRQEFAIRETAWRFAAALAGIAAVSFTLPVWPARLVWILAAAAAVIAGCQLSNAPSRDARVGAPTTFLDRIEFAAAREWNLPTIWRVGIALPLRGAAQVLRFADGFVFEQLPAVGVRKFHSVLTPVRNIIPELFSRLLLVVLAMAAFLVLVTLAFR